VNRPAQPKWVGRVPAASAARMTDISHFREMGAGGGLHFVRGRWLKYSRSRLTQQKT
jgi:hypothetical protein